jgi:signal transduction histidine kinase
MNQSLYSVVLFAGAGQKEAENAGMLTLQRNLERIENMARQALKEMRLMVFELRPKVLEQMGLIGALQQRLDVVERGAGVDVKLVTEGELDLTPEVEGTLYRIIQEALNNSLKHGRGDSVIVQLVEKDRQVRVMIADNGCGFKLHGSDGSKGMGITNMRERAEELNAVLSIHSSPGEGTEIEVLLPANNHPNQATGAAE